MEKTGEGLCDYARKKLGTPYFFGAKMQLLTEEFMQTMHRKYPSVVTEQYMEMAIHRGLPGRVCCDCSGLIAGYTGRSFGTAQLYASASLRMSVENNRSISGRNTSLEKGTCGRLYRIYG